MTVQRSAAELAAPTSPTLAGSVTYSGTLSHRGSDLRRGNFIADVEISGLLTAGRYRVFGRRPSGALRAGADAVWQSFATGIDSDLLLSGKFSVNGMLYVQRRGARMAAGILSLAT